MDQQAKFNYFTAILSIVAAVGAINWGLLQAFDFNLVTAIYGVGKATVFIYYLVGVSGLYVLVTNLMLLLGKR